MRQVVWEPKTNNKQLIFLQNRIAGRNIQQACSEAGITWTTGKRWNNLPEVQEHMRLGVEETVTRIIPKVDEMEIIKKVILDASVYSTMYLTEVVKDVETPQKTRVDIAKFFATTFMLPLYNTGSMNKPNEQVEQKSSEIEDLFLSVS